MLLPIFRSDAQAKLLATLFLDAGDRGLTLSEIARRSGLAKSQVSRELARLEAGGLTVSERIGRARLVRPDSTSPLHGPLEELVLRALGPVPVIRSLLNGVEGVECAYIFGSWAARYAGVPGPSPADIDLLIVGDPPADQMHELADAAEAALAREVNPTVVTAKRWADAADGFVRTLRDRPLVAVVEPR
jgi:DNA-binding transcriptional ArsR family regulator